MIVRNRFPHIMAKLPRQAQNALRQGAGVVAERAKSRAPDAPPLGEGLKQSIHVAYTRKGAPTGTSGGYAVIAGDEDVFYGHMVEHGTSHSAPHPFLIPALEESKAEVVALVQASLKGL